MPASSNCGKQWTGQTIDKIQKQISITRILDIGVGIGTYYNLFKDRLPNAHWTGIEVWQPYIDQYDLKNKYHDILACDARTLDYAVLPGMDMVFAGDVLEHMTKIQAQELAHQILSHHRCLLVSIPIVYMPQDAYEGNPYEIHVKPDWTNQEFVDTFGTHIVDHVNDDYIGVYLLSYDTDFKNNYKQH